MLHMVQSEEAGTLKKYHRDVWMPPVKLVDYPYVLEYSTHAIRAAQERLMNRTRWLPRTYRPRLEELVELYTLDGKIEKFLFRTKFDAESDILMVLARTTERFKFFVRTVWLNGVDDQHRTLKYWEYEQPPVRKSEP